MILNPDRYLSAHERKVRRRRMWVWFAVFLIGLVVVSAFDQRWYHVFLSEDRARLERRDWYRLLRIMGYLPTWILISLFLALGPWGKMANRESRMANGGEPDASASLRGTAWLPVLSAGLSGAAAELLKLVIGRERPLPDGSYRFKSFFYGFVDGSNLGMPSSHAAVAFGGAFMLARLFPGLRVVALLLAIGCGVTRMWMGAHFATDVYAAAGLGYAMAWWLSGGRVGIGERSGV